MTTPTEALLKRLEQLSTKRCQYSELSPDLYEQGYSDCHMHFQELLAETIYLYNTDCILEIRNKILDEEDIQYVG